jgi:hypothetical protein
MGKLFWHDDQSDERNQIQQLASFHNSSNDEYIYIACI